MVIVGFDIVAALIIREKRRRSRQGRTLERRIAAWKQEVEQARWREPTEVKSVFGRADVVGGNRVVFDVCGNNYRIFVFRMRASEPDAGNASGIRQNRREDDMSTIS